MRKTDKKIDNQLRAALTEVCDTSLKTFSGFQWLTHLVNYSNFPKSLKIVCIFDTNDNLSDFIAMKSNIEFNALIQASLVDLGINIKTIDNHIAYDTEENCKKNHNGKWADRLGA